MVGGGGDKQWSSEHTEFKFPFDITAFHLGHTADSKTTGPFCEIK